MVDRGMHVSLIFVIVLISVVCRNDIARESPGAAVRVTFPEVCDGQGPIKSRTLVRLLGQYKSNMHGAGLNPVEGPFPVEYGDNTYGCAVHLSFNETGEFSGSSFLRGLMADKGCIDTGDQSSHCLVEVTGYVETVASAPRREWFFVRENPHGYGHMNETFAQMRVVLFSIAKAIDRSSETTER